MSVPPPPGDIGQRLLPSLVDSIAQSDPSRVLYSAPKTKDPAEGFQDITAQEFARVVDRVAWHLEETLGHGENFPTITYLGPQDVMYAVLVLASVKAGYKLLLNSPRNPLEAHLSLFEATDCHIFLKPPIFPLPVVKQILDKRPMKVVDIPPLPQWQQPQDGPEKPFPYNKTFAEARSEPFVVLHTSGSTGMPKPIVQTHGTVAAMDAFTALPSLGLPDTYPAMCAGKRVYNAFPLFHCAGISMLLPCSIYAGFTIVLGPFPPSADAANAIHVHGNVQHSCLAPMTMIDLVKDPEHLENLSRLEQITYGGGPCPPAVGDQIARKTRLLNCLGTTECAVLPVQLCDQESWSYMSVSPALGHEYRHVAGDLYEQVIVRKPELDLYQGIFQTFPDLQEWPMKDLYTKHPTRENHWLYRGRSDDIVVFSTGEKLNPVDMEGVIGAHSGVSGALIAGQGQTQSSLLLEVPHPPATKEDANKLIEEIWPSVENANKISPSHGRILRDMVIFTSPDKPMLRAGKGTVQRKLTLNLYEAELKALYKRNESLNGTTNGSVAADQSAASAVRAILSISTDIDLSTAAPDTDLFDLGLDSLQVTVIAKRINEFLATTGIQQSITTRAVYANASLEGLTAVLSSLLSGGSAEAGGGKWTPETLYGEFAKELPIVSRQAPVPSHPPAGGHVVLLTGSTGSLGSYMLDALQKDQSVSKVYCLNRGPNSAERQAQSQHDRGLAAASPEKIAYLDANLSEPALGLAQDEYKKLLGEVTNVVHNAWQVDWNLPLDAFYGHIQAVKRLVDFSVHSQSGAPIFFVSSVGAVVGLSGPVEERIYAEWTAPEEMGYAQSKFVAERLLDTAARQSGVPVAVCRVGQVAGPTTQSGSWPQQEWLPSLVFSSAHLGKLSSSLGRMDSVDWVPVDILSQAIVELAKAPLPGGSGDAGATVYHAANPNRTSWSSLLPSIQKALGSAAEVVSLPDWVASLRESSSESEDLAKNPATKITEFYEALGKGQENPPSLEIKNTLAASPTLASLQPIDAGMVENWLRQWGFKV